MSPAARRRLLGPALAVLVAAGAAVAAGPAGAEAQAPAGASTFLHPEHWAHEAVRSLHGAGLLPPGLDRGSRSLTRLEAGYLLQAALERAGAERSELASLARSYVGRYGTEFPGIEARLTGEKTRTGVRAEWVRVSQDWRRGQVLPGRYIDFDRSSWTGARPVFDQARTGVQLHMTADALTHLAAAATPSWDDGEWSLESGYLTASWGPWGMWAGRRSSGYGGGGGRGVVLNPVVAVDGGGVFLDRPLILPWLFRHLGPVRGEMFASRIPDNGAINQIWFFGTRGSISPHPRLGLGITRGAMIAGDGTLQLGDILYVFGGGHAGGSQYDNQVASLDLWWRPPVGDLPLMATVEWGFEDNAGAISDVPGIVAALEVSAIPSLPELGVGLEHARFRPSCCGNPPWYRHPIGFLEGWTIDGRLLGHRLGGHGTEWLARARATLADATVILTAESYLRDRGHENAFEPQREGRSAGGAIGAELFAASRLLLTLDAELERGVADWSSTRVAVAAKWWF